MDAFPAPSTTRLTTFDDADLDALDALDAALFGLTSRPPAEVDDAPAEPAGRAREGKQRPRRQKGEPLDPAALEAAKVGLPYFSQLQWMCCQLLDKGDAPTRGHVRWRLKIEAAGTPDLEKCTRRGLQQMARVRWVMLSRPVAFLDNFDRKAKKFPLLHPARECRPIADTLAEAARASDEANVPAGAPPCLLGFVSTRLQGTHSYGGQYASWRGAGTTPGAGRRSRC